MVKEEIDHMLISDMIQFIKIKIMFVECYFGHKFVLFSLKFVELLLHMQDKLHLTFEVSSVNVVCLTLNKQDKGICAASSYMILELFAIYLFSK